MPGWKTYCVVAWSLILAACVGRVALGEEFELQEGQSRAVDGTDLRITLQSVGYYWDENGVHHPMVELLVALDGVEDSRMLEDELEVGEFTINMLGINLLEDSCKLSVRPGGISSLTLTTEGKETPLPPLMTQTAADRSILPTSAKTATPVALSDITPTETIAPARTNTPSPTIPFTPTISPTFSEADWENLPPLAELALTPEEIFEEVAIPPDALVDWQVVRSTDQGDCQIDCATITLQTSSRDLSQLSLQMLRTMSPDEARQLVESRYDETLEGLAGESSYRYTESNLRLLRDAPPGTWVIDWTLHEMIVGTNHGSVALLLHWGYDFCEVQEDGTRYCEGDAWNVAVKALEVALQQLTKLHAAGYPP